MDSGVYNVYIGKVWQTKNLNLCFEIKSKDLKDKTYLIIDLKKNQLTLGKEKPSNIIMQGAIANILRKHLTSKVIKTNGKDQLTNDWLITFGRALEEKPAFLIELKKNQCE